MLPARVEKPYFQSKNNFQFLLLGSTSLMMFGITTFISTFIIGRTSRKKILRISLAVYAVGTIILLFSSNPMSIGIGLAVQALFVSKCFIFFTILFQICTEKYLILNLNEFTVTRVSYIKKKKKNFE